MNPLVKLLLGYAAKVYGIQEDEVAALLFQKNAEDETLFDYEKVKPEALTALLSKDKERVKELKDAVDKTGIYDKAYADAKKEVLAKEEKKLAKKYGIEGEKFELNKLVEDIVAAQVSTASLDPKKLDADAIKTHPAYLALENQKNKELQELKTSQEEELTKLQEATKRTETWTGNVKPLISTIFDGLNPVLSTEGTRAANQKTDFIARFKDYDYQEDNGKHIVLKDGKRLEDEHGNAIYLDQFVEQKASTLFDFAKQSDKDGPGNSGGAGKNSTVPKSQDEYDLAIINAKDSEERESIRTTWEASKTE